MKLTAQIAVGTVVGLLAIFLITGLVLFIYSVAPASENGVAYDIGFSIGNGLRSMQAFLPYACALFLLALAFTGYKAFRR